MTNFLKFSDRPLLLLTSKPWNTSLSSKLTSSLGCSVKCISSKEQLSFDIVKDIDPAWIFVPHWNHIIPECIWSKWNTVIFHMTDLPFGRGGSPLQNLIKSGITSTKICAIRCDQGLDTGDIYLKEPFSLYGSAEEVFLRANTVIQQMIEYIVVHDPQPVPQEGEPFVFNRRTPSQSNLLSCPSGDTQAWYDHIRMLDAPGYPHGFLQVNGMKLEFTRVSRRSDGLYADVRISPINPSEHHE